MLEPTERWRDFEREDERRSYDHLDYIEALARFERLWRYARQVNPDIGRDWPEDLAADLAIARAVNGLPPSR